MLKWLAGLAEAAMAGSVEQHSSKRHACRVRLCSCASMSLLLVHILLSLTLC